VRAFASNSRIFIAGARGMVGSALVRKLRSEGFENLLTPTSKELDLTNQAQVNQFFASQKVDFVFLAAARVGGIVANNSFPADFLYENIMIGSNIIRAAADFNVEKLLFLGSSCIYPRLAPQPMTEDCLLTSSLEKTNEAYALAKISSLKMCEYYQRQYGKRFISAMPTNLYGIGDNYHATHSHVIPGMLRRFFEAKKNKSPQVEVWGTGKVRREFLEVDELAEALVLLMRKYEGTEPVNVGCGQDLSIAELAQLVKTCVGYQGEIIFDTSKPDGTPRKLLEVSKMKNLGWQSKLPLSEGLAKAFAWAVGNGKL
jgi:GDP-L-fucose synthase